MSHSPAHSGPQPAAHPRVIGLTGGIAAGKSTVSQMLAACGAYVIDADRIGHEVIAPDGEAYPEIIVTFGTGVLDEDGTISRPKLARVVFNDPEALQRLNGISHPRMAERMEREIRQIRARPRADQPALIVLDAAILFEAGWDALCDEVWAVNVAPEVAVERLVQRNDMTPEDARARLQAQLGNAERARRADRVIRNEGSLEALHDQVQGLWRQAADVPCGGR